MRVEFAWVHCLYARQRPPVTVDGGNDQVPNYKRFTEMRVLQVNQSGVLKTCHAHGKSQYSVSFGIQLSRQFLHRQSSRTPICHSVWNNESLVLPLIRITTDLSKDIGIPSTFPLVMVGVH